MPDSCGKTGENTIKKKRHRIHPVSKLRKKPFGEKELFTMADFSINYRLFIDPLGNEHRERKKIDGFSTSFPHPGSQGSFPLGTGRPAGPDTLSAIPAGCSLPSCLPSPSTEAGSATSSPAADSTCASPISCRGIHPATRPSAGSSTGACSRTRKGYSHWSPPRSAGRWASIPARRSSWTGRS